MSLRNNYNRVLHKLVEDTNPLLGIFRRKWGNINPDFTIISNNCWAGSVYRWYHLPYLTPTAGLYFYADEYMRFLSNINYYLSLNPEPISLKESRHKESLIYKGQINVPLGRIDDVEIVFLHYPTFEVAREKWLRRTARINWENLIIKNSEMNGCTESNVREFDRLPFERKFIFTTRNYDVDSQVIFREYLGSEQVKDDTMLFNKYIDVTNLIKGKPFKLRQEI
jgi:uncharacterized protein (DUF1919 family)